MAEDCRLVPPPGLVDKWRNDWDRAKVKHLSTYAFIATQAARWGADQELDACSELVRDNDGYDAALALRADRRPKPPSLKELNLKHLDVMERDGHYLPEIISDLRRAIESLPS